MSGLLDTYIANETGEALLLMISKRAGHTLIILSKKKLLHSNNVLGTSTAIDFAGAKEIEGSKYIGSGSWG